MNYILRKKGLGMHMEEVKNLSKTGLEVVRNDQVPDDFWKASWIFRWGTVTEIGGHSRAVNLAKYIEVTSNKKKFRALMASKDLAPVTAISFESALDLPFGGKQYLFRPAYHQRSEDMILCESVKAIHSAFDKHGGDGYVPEFILKKREFRVLCSQGRVIAVIEKHPQSEKEVSWGCVQEGNFDYVPWGEWPLVATRKALEAMSLSGLDFGAVDVIFGCDASGGSENYYCLEINTAPFMSPYYLKCFVKAFDFIVEKNDKTTLKVEDDKSYKSHIHPAILGAA